MQLLHNGECTEACTLHKTFKGSLCSRNVAAGFLARVLHLNLEGFGVSVLFGDAGMETVTQQNVSCSDVMQHTNTYLKVVAKPDEHA